MHVDKLWRIFYDPRKVFDELRENQQFRLPLVTLLAAIGISTLVVALLNPTPTFEDLDEIRNELLLLADEPDRELVDSRIGELRKKLISPRDLLPMGEKLTATLWDVPVSIIGCLLGITLAAWSFWLVGLSIKSSIRWKQWFGFAAWVELPAVPIALLDVVFAALDRDRPHISFEFGTMDISVTYWALWLFFSLIIAVGGLRSWTSKGALICIALTGIAFVIQIASLLLALGVFAPVLLMLK